VIRRVLIADDEPPARERLRSLLAEQGGCEVVAECGSGDEAVRAAATLRPDVVLLDVRMPGMDGLEAARHMALLPEPPSIVFVTAFEQYAVDAFDAEAVDYLLKPVRASRLANALERAARLGSARLERVVSATPTPAPRTHLAARIGDTVRLIPVADVHYFSADQKYTRVSHRGGTDLIDDPLRALEEEFRSDFVRVHRAALVSLQQMAAIERTPDGQFNVVLRSSGERLRVSRRMAAELRERLHL
jgi:two-component system response regulator AlgR